MLRAFAERYRLKIRRDECNEAVIPGRRWSVRDRTAASLRVRTSEGPHIAEHDKARLAIVLVNLTPRTWGNRRRAGVSAGMTVHLDGDAEGILLFDPSDEAQAQLAIKLAAVKPKRVPSAAQIEVIRRNLQRLHAPGRGTVSDPKRNSRP